MYWQPVRASLKDLNDIFEVLHAGKYCVALSLDLAEAFDMVDEGTLRQGFRDWVHRPF